MTRAPDILREIASRRRERLRADRSRPAAAATLGGEATAPRERSSPFPQVLRGARGHAIIAEVKLGSPRLGSLAGRIDPERQAELYAGAGATALSVVVEPEFFGGSYELLVRCRRACGLPTLAKDFVVDPVQLEWAREAGADAVLLIAALLSGEELRRFAAIARQLGLTPLVECHAPVDVERLGEEPWELIGVNNRDLRTFEVDLERSVELLQRLPAAAVKVAESGIRTAADVRRLATAGFDAFLVGEALLQARDPAAELRRLVGAEA